jgi:hypothetical protein
MIDALWRRMKLMCAALLFAAALALPFSGAFAQQAAAPVQLSDEQVNQIVQSVTDAVVKQMKAGQPPAAAPAQSEKSILAIDEGIASFLQNEKLDLVADFDTALAS